LSATVRSSNWTGIVSWRYARKSDAPIEKSPATKRSTRGSTSMLMKGGPLRGTNVALGAIVERSLDIGARGKKCGVMPDGSGPRGVRRSGGARLDQACRALFASALLSMSCNESCTCSSRTAS
jgi:hypothetical protein